MSMDEPKVDDMIPTGPEAFAAIWQVYVSCPRFTVHVCAATGPRNPAGGFPMPLVVWKLVPEEDEPIAMAMTPKEARALAEHLDKVAEELDDGRSMLHLGSCLREVADAADEDAPRLQ